ncbi:hypothetical protein RRG08_054204 [Elysia crispata]|uniref:Uncharacterized protein n=1 Tax=Elysia crispata TaxID=231223 RepID=A0AAE0YCM2_9GAST|nr:hypothetical protein RRG08_054204 [Elysia crispata]
MDTSRDEAQQVQEVSTEGEAIFASQPVKKKEKDRTEGVKRKDREGDKNAVVSFENIESDHGSYKERESNEETSSRFFGFFETVANSDWLKPFQTSAATYSEPLPAAWDTEFEDDEEEGKGKQKKEKDSRIKNEENKNIDAENKDDDGHFFVRQINRAKNPSQVTEKDLFAIFHDKLSKISEKALSLDDTCYDERTLANSCENGKCQQTKLPAEPEERVRQLIQHPGLKLSASQHAVLQEMASKVRKSYDVILLTAASSNYYSNSQALLQNLHKHVFPVLKNFTLLFYDIGLTPDERSQMEKYCQCQVLSFPFEKHPDYVLTKLRCYAWKPLMIKAHIRQANVVLWLDASIRFNGDPNQLKQLVQRVKDRGVQIGSSARDTTFRSFRSLYHYFGDEPCMYLGMVQAKANIGGYHNEPLVERVILEPWAACGLHQECMCPDNGLKAGCFKRKEIIENYEKSENDGPIMYGQCHHFDQSTISLILHKLYQGNYPWVMMNVHHYGGIFRFHKANYFKDLDK